MPDALVERDGPVMTITMNRPKRLNALTGEMLIIMHDAMVEASEDPDVRCIILTGAEGNFCAGADLRAMAGDADEGGTVDVAARMAAEPAIGYSDQRASDTPKRALSPATRISVACRISVPPAMATPSTAASNGFDGW